MRHRGLRFAALACAGLSLTTLLAHEVCGAVSYTTPGATYSQDFDSLPNTPTNTSLEATIPWIDDSTSSATNTSIPGWYLYHNATQTGEGGTNDHQRFRITTGGGSNSNTGSFYSFGVAGTNPVTDRALGNLTSNTIDDSFYGVRLTNNTGMALGQMTLQYTAEQWRDGAMATTGSVAQSVNFGYAITSSAPTNIGTFNATSNPGGISGAVTVGALGFASPIFGATTAVALDGNAAANRVAKSLTFGGFDWQPGQDLWLRWSDIDHASNDHGMGIDDLTFSANVAVNVFSVASGLASDANTWSDNQAPSAVKNYHVVDGDIVTLDAAFPGDILSVEDGAVDIDAGGSGKSFPLLSIETGGNLTESVIGDITLGTASSTLRVNRNLTFNGFEPGSKFTLAADVTGSGDLNFESNSASSELILSRAGNHQGTIRFNGSGDAVRLLGPENFNVLEMNSTGANVLSYESTAGGQILGNRVVFNQPGTLDHATNVSRTHGPFTLVANAPVTVDLTKTFPSSGTPTDERRMLIGDDAGRLEGSADIMVNGTSTAPTGGNITKNEFEIGGTSPEPTTIPTDSYSGTITGNDYVDFEIRHNLPNARFVINNNAWLEMGHQLVASTQTIRLGDVQINSGGTLEVGFEQGSAAIDGHHAYHLTLTAEGARDGDLTLADGATTVMQINGPPANQAEYDRISAQGDVALDGTLQVLINPVSSSTSQINPTYSPSIGDTFDIISIAPVVANGDYNGNGSVGPEDYDVWRASFDNAVAPGTGADGNGNGVVDAADYVLWRKHNGEMSGMVGAITGTFDNLAVVDPTGAFGGLSFQVNYTPTLVQLQVIQAAGSVLSAVPEPTSLVLMAMLLPTLLAGRRRRSAR